MIELRDLSKTFETPGGPKSVAASITVRFPARRPVALLGRNGAGKSTLLRMIAGLTRPDAGTIIRQGTVSWPVGHGGGFHRELSAAQNIRFVARAYGVDSTALVDFVQSFAEIGAHFRMPVKTLSSGMHSRVAFGLSMGIGFDTYLFDEVTAVGDRRFRDKCHEAMNARLETSSAIVATHSIAQVRRVCRSAAVLENGRLQWFDDIEAALAVHAGNLDRAA